MPGSRGRLRARVHVRKGRVVATGIDTFLGVDPYTKGGPGVVGLLQGSIKDWVGANYTVELDIEKLGDKMMERIEEKRAALGI